MSPDITHAIENTIHSRAGLKRALSRQLVHNAIRQRIRKRDSEFEQIRAGLFHRERQLRCP